MRCEGMLSSSRMLKGYLRLPKAHHDSTCIKSCSTFSGVPFQTCVENEMMKDHCIAVARVESYTNENENCAVRRGHAMKLLFVKGIMILWS